MPYAERLRECADCGAIIKGRLPPSKEVRCIECNIKISTGNSLDMHFKRGVGYAHWLESRGPQGRPRKQPP